MRVQFDTSVLVPSMLRAHPQHGAAQAWMARAKSREFEMIVAAHSLAELYSVLTDMRTFQRIAPAPAVRLIRENVLDQARIVALTDSDYANVLEHVAGLGWTGGAIYDALIATTARKADVDHLLTFDVEDFRRVWPDAGERIRQP